MSELKARMINTLERNRISTVEVADALGKSGVLAGISPLNQRRFAVGEVHYIYTWDESNWPLHEQITHVPEDSIVFIDSYQCGDKALFGELVAKYLLLYRKAQAIVTNGPVRDAHRMLKEGWPIWCQGVTPLGCHNRAVPLHPEVVAWSEQRRTALEGGILVCDDSGCPLIAPELITPDTLRKLEFMELQEDIWFYCIDTLKWSTFDTVCLKRYLEDKNVLPPLLRERLAEFDL